MFPISLYVFFESDSGLKLSELDIETSLGDCDLREMTFYCIHAISTYIDHVTEKQYCMIHTNNDEFITNAKYKDIKALLNQKLNLN